MGMNPEFKARWVEALRSGKYAQTQNKLFDGEGYCCLGVACDILVKDGVIEYQIEGCGNEGCCASHTFGTNGDWNGTTLPATAVEYMGVEDENPDVMYQEKMVTLADLNDKYQLSLPEIADIIEEQL